MVGVAPHTQQVALIGEDAADGFWFLGNIKNKMGIKADNLYQRYAAIFACNANVSGEGSKRRHMAVEFKKT